MISIYMFILTWFFITGWREGYTWADQSRKIELDNSVFDYHCIRLIEGLIVFLLCTTNNIEIVVINVIRCFLVWNIGNWIYEKTLRYVMDKSWHGNEKTFRIFGKDIFYRWWLYELFAVISLIILFFI